MSFHASYSTWSWRLLSPIQNGGTSRYIEVGATWVRFLSIPQQICASWLAPGDSGSSNEVNPELGKQGRSGCCWPQGSCLDKEIFLELLLVLLLGAKDSNILLLIWVCLRNGDVFAKQTTQCIEIVQSNQSSWDCLSFIPNSILFCCTSQVSWIIFISIWGSESWVHQILHNLQAVCAIVLHSNLHHCQAFF